VQIDKTAESCKELQREITEYVTGKAPAKPEELTKIQSVQIRALPGQYETGNAVLGTLSSIVLYGRPDDYPQQRANRVAQQTLESFKMSARAIKPSALLWIIVGDLKKIEAPIRAAGLGDVQIVDADGKVVR